MFKIHLVAHHFSPSLLLPHSSNIWSNNLNYCNNFPAFLKVKWSENHSDVSSTLWPPGLYSPWDSPGQNTGVGSLYLLQRNIPNPGIRPMSPSLQADSWPAEPPGKPFDCVDHNKLWTILKEMGIQEHLTHHLRNLYADQEATVRTVHGATNWFQIGKVVCQACILSPFIFNLYAEYIMWNAGLDEAQDGIKISWRNINNLEYTDDTTIMAESKELLKSLLMKVKVKEKSEKSCLKNSTFKKLRSWHPVPSLHGK